MLAEDRAQIPNIISSLSDETKQKEFLIEDEEEDFLDEGNFETLNHLMEHVHKIK